MAQNERQGIGTEKAGTKTGAEGTGPLASSRVTAAEGSETTGEQGRVDIGSQGAGTGRDVGQSGGRLSRSPAGSRLLRCDCCEAASGAGPA